MLSEDPIPQGYSPRLDPDGGGSPALEVEVFVAPWALVGEEIPLLLQWTPDNTVSSVSLSVPPGFEFIRALNSDEPRIDQERIILGKWRSPGYCGFFLRKTAIEESVLVRTPCRIRMDLANGTSLERDCALTVIRPKLEFIGDPRPLAIARSAITNNGSESPYVVNLLQTGLGAVIIDLKCKFKGLVISRSDELVRDVLRQVLKMTRSGGPDESEQGDLVVAREMKGLGLEVELDPFASEDVEKLREQVISYINLGELPEELSSTEELIVAREWLESVDMKELNKLASELILHQLSRQLLEGIGKYPSDFAELRAGPTSIHFSGKTESFMIIVHYSDSRGNSYPTIERLVPVVDHRPQGQESTQESTVPRVVPIRVEVKTELLSGLEP